MGTYSTLLGLPETAETKTPVEADHSNMVNFKSMADTSYKSVREFMNIVIRDAPKVVSNRFSMYPDPLVSLLLNDFLTPCI